MTLSDYTAEKLQTRKWVVAKRTARLSARYDVFLTDAAYAKIQADYLADGGDPMLVNPSVAEACGYVLTFVKAA
jgi:hypothetical protein